MHLYKKKKSGGGVLALFLIFLCAAVLLVGGSRQMEQTARREQTALLKEAIDQAMISCYAIEGRYPESLAYLKENYGIQVDTEKYAVTYEVFADNVRPEVKVVRLEE